MLRPTCIADEPFGAVPRAPRTSGRSKVATKRAAAAAAAARSESPESDLEGAGVEGSQGSKGGANGRADPSEKIFKMREENRERQHRCAPGQLFRVAAVLRHCCALLRACSACRCRRSSLILL